MLKIFKKERDTIDMKTGEFINYQPVNPWTKVKNIRVDTINGSHEGYENVEFRVINNNLIIQGDDSFYVVYNLKNVIKYFYNDIAPHSK